MAKKKKRTPKADSNATARKSNTTPQSGGIDFLSQLFMNLHHGMIQNYLSLKPESDCNHGNRFLSKTSDCHVANLFITAYEDALNMVADALCNKDKITSEMALAMAASPLGHAKVLDALKGNMARPMWDDPAHTDKIHKYLVCFGTNLLLKDTPRHTNMAMIVAHSIVELEQRGVIATADEGKRNSWGSFGLSAEEFVGSGSVDTNPVSFFSERNDCSCLQTIDGEVNIDVEVANAHSTKTLMEEKKKPHCANCGKQDGQLKTCNGCKTVKYCSSTCQRANWSEHKMDCQTIAQGLRDVELFKEPSKRKDCDICCLPLPLNRCRVMYQTCCGQTICYGCLHFARQEQAQKKEICPYCRQEGVKSYPQAVEQLKQRMELNDPGAFCTLGCKYRDGIHSCPQDYKKAFELFQRAAELGSVDAMYHVGWSYYMGQGVEKDEEKAKIIFEECAIKGCENARFNLAFFEHNTKRANKHLMIAARQEVDEAFKLVCKEYKMGRISKEEYEYTKRQHYEIANEMKSEQREEAAAIYNLLGGVLDM